jgi:hypothetical protein
MLICYNMPLFLRPEATEDVEDGIVYIIRQEIDNHEQSLYP